jgi:hypothetical protein
MATYSQILENKFEASGAATIKGVALDVGDDHPLKAKGYIPVLASHCVCVTEPCPCDDRDDQIVWLPQNAIRSRKATEHKTKSGETQEAFQVARDADVITETFTTRKASSFDPLAKAAHGTHPAKFSPTSSHRIMHFATVCAGNTLYIVREGPDGSGGTLFEYIPIGSCETVAS